MEIPRLKRKCILSIAYQSIIMHLNIISATCFFCLKQATFQRTHVFQIGLSAWYNMTSPFRNSPSTAEWSHDGIWTKLRWSIKGCHISWLPCRQQNTLSSKNVSIQLVVVFEKQLYKTDTSAEYSCWNKSGIKRHSRQSRNSMKFMFFDRWYWNCWGVPTGVKQKSLIQNLEIPKLGFESTWATKKTRPYVPWNTGWLIGILIMVYEIMPYITG